jgi:hypothetical protein
VHGDLCGPVTPATPRGRRYFLLLVDDLSRYMWVMVLDSKGEDADAIKRAGRCGGGVRTQAARYGHRQRRLNLRRTVWMRVFSATTLHRTTRSRMASSSGATRRL